MSSEKDPVLVPDQPPPTGDGPELWPRVIARERRPAVRALMEERDRIGRARYGTPLRAFNGRDPQIDALQEVLDARVYLEQVEVEGAAERLPALQMMIGMIDMVIEGLLPPAVAEQASRAASEPGSPAMWCPKRSSQGQHCELVAGHAGRCSNSGEGFIGVDPTRWMGSTGGSQVTHWDGCRSVHPECALAEIDRLTAENKALRADLARLDRLRVELAKSPG